MQKYLDINGVKVLIQIMNEKIEAIEIPEVPSLEEYVKLEQLKDYVTDSELEEIKKEIPTDVPSIWKGTQSEYDEIHDKDPNTLYLIKED